MFDQMKKMMELKKQADQLKKELEKITHDHVEHIDRALGRKEQELLEV